MALVGEMQYLTIGGNTYSLPSGGGGSVTSVGVSNATDGGLTVSGSPITSSGAVTIGHTNVLASAQSTLAVYPIKIDKNGHISEYGSAVSIPTKVSDLTNDSGFITGMEILSYGNSTWQDFLTAYNAKKVVYCRASSNSNPASGSQTRLAFMTYVNNGDSPTEVEFQYYRSVSSHTSSQQGDQVFVYKITSAGTWTVTTREASSKVAAGGDLTSSYANGTITISGDIPTVPTNVSAFTNDAGYLTTETDPTVPSWAKAESKPTYTYSEVGAAASSHSHGNITSGGDITTTATIANGDRIIINDESASKVTNSSITFGTSDSQYLANSGTWQNLPTIPTKVSDLTNDSGYITGYTETDPIFTASAAHGISSSDITNWNGKQAALVSGTNIKTVNNESLLGSGNITVSTVAAQIIRW